MTFAYFFFVWAFFDDFPTLASLMSDFSPLGLFFNDLVLKATKNYIK
jgi:hypothetical protein